MRLRRPSTQDPINSPLGLSLTQDFPPLVSPQTIVTSKSQRKPANANGASPVVKPVVPVLPTQLSLATIHAKESQGNNASEKVIEATNKLTSTVNNAQVASLSAKSKAKPKAAATDTSSSIQVKSNFASVVEAPTTKLSYIQQKPDSKSDSEGVMAASETSAERLQQLGELDIAAAKETSKLEVDSAEIAPTQYRLDELVLNAAVSRPSTPATAESQNSASSMTRPVQSRTIRVLTTNKTETPPRLPLASPSILSTVPSFPNKKQPSRRGSFASVQLPGTPVSERISDNASLTSASISRASSPPPTKIGSAPVRQVTKSQQKKERQARAKLAEEKSKTEEGPTKAIVEEPVQAPILGRKKKTKKATTKDTADSTPTATRSSSPIPKDEAANEQLALAAAAPPKEHRQDVNKASKDRNEADIPASPAHSSHGDCQKKNAPTATAIMASFQKSANFSFTVLEMFKGVPGVNHRIELTHDDITESTMDPILSAAQMRQINDGEAIVINKATNRPIVVLPDHSLLHGLSVDHAERYLYLRQQLISTPASVAFHSSDHEIGHYIHVAPHPSVNSSGANLSGDLNNRFEAPPLSQPAATVSMPPYWSTASLKGENMLRRGPPKTLEEANQNMLEAEQAWMSGRKETEVLEKKLNALIKKNRKTFLGSLQ